MKTRTFTFTLMAVLLAFSGSAIAAPKICDDGSRPPCDGGGDGAAPDFGDLIKLYRDDDGVPYLTADGCWQPLPSDTCDTTVCGLVAGVDGVLEIPGSPLVIPVAPDSCGVLAACAACTEEVDFGRINEARSPASVFEAQLEDVVVSLATADCVTLDPAGRLVASQAPDDTTLDNLAKTIDSPLQNLAIYRQLMLTGDIGVALPDGTTVLDTAARGLGAASDKSGGINEDLVAYLNQIMGLSDPATTTILDPKICQPRKQEVQGVVQLVEECFLDYGAYLYNRTTNFAALPDPAYIPESGPTDGWFEYLALVAGTELDPRFQILQGPILNAVFGIDLVTGSNIGGFAQASDDTRAVISFMHENQVPVDFETQVLCADSGAIFYDLSISEQSGLQVPVQYVNGGEREFTVTVANLGPDMANGTVTVTADQAGVEPGTGDLGTWVYPFVDLAAGSTYSPGPVVFQFDLGQSTTISWTAAVVAGGPGTDPNAGNNFVTATTSVKNTGGGGGGQGGRP